MIKSNYKIILLTFLITVTALSIVFTLSANAQKYKTTGKNVSSAVADYNYVLKEFNGKPAVFEKNGTSPVFVLDVYLSELPPKDQAKIINGITANSFEEIMSAAENYE